MQVVRGGVEGGDWKVVAGCGKPVRSGDGALVGVCAGARRGSVTGRGSLVGRLGLGGGVLVGAQVGDVLAVAGAVDVDADGVHGEPVEDGDGDGGVAEVAPPVAESDVGGDGGGDAAVPAVDEVEEGVGGGGLVVALLDLAEANVVDDEQVGAGPGLEAPGVGVVGEAGVEVVEQVDAAGVAQARCPARRRAGRRP